MPPKQIASVRSLRKHAAETKTIRNQAEQPQRRIIVKDSNTDDPDQPRSSISIRPIGTTQKRSDKSYPGVQPKSAPKRSETRSESSESSDDASSSKDSVTDSDSDDYGSIKEDVHEPVESKRPRLAVDTHTTVFQGMPMPEYKIDQDVKHYISDMTTYLEQHSHLPETYRAKLALAGVKGEARDVLMGYADADMDTPRKLFKILNREFKKREKSARGLHQLKQDSNEKVSIFAGRIRRYVRGLGVSKQRFDHNCVEFLKLGSTPPIQNRLQQRNPKSFAKAIKLAIEAEAEKPMKLKQKVDTINQIDEVSNLGLIGIQRSIQDLNNVIQQFKTGDKTPFKRDNRITIRADGRIGNGVKGACFVCDKKGHRYLQCFRATEQDKQKITGQLERDKELKE